MIIAVKRAKRYSPNSEEKDATILECVTKKLAHRGLDVVTLDEDTMGTANGLTTGYITMGRSEATLALLTDEERKGAVVVNTPEGVALCCNRRQLNDTLRRGGVPVPPEEGRNGYWLKRGDGVAETHDDVRFAANKAEAETLKEKMARSGIGDIVVQAHMVGDLVKFYGVRGTTFFRTYYTGDGHASKFGDEQRNGAPHYYKYDQEELHRTAERAAKLAGIDVYGGDCVVGSDGRFTIIDFNDWPSFSRCVDEAAEAIAQRVIGRLKGATLQEANKKEHNADI